MNKSTKANSKFALLLFLIIFSLLAVFFSFLIHNFKQSIEVAPKKEAKIISINKLKFLGGEYKALLYNADGSELRKIRILSYDMFDIYKPDEKVEVALTEKDIVVTNNLNNKFYGIAFLVIWLFPLMFFLGLLQTPSSKIILKGSGLVMFAFGTILLVIGFYHFKQQKVFYDYSSAAQGKVIKHAVNICKDEDDGDYTCYSRVVEYTAADQNEYQITESARWGWKKGDIGDEIKIRYLKGNPEEGQIVSKWVIDLLSILAILMGSFLIYKASRPIRPK